MGQELGRALVNFGKPAEENVEPCAYIAEGQTEFSIPAQYCETQQCWDEDQRTNVAEEEKEKTGACSESVVLQTDDSKIAQILRRKQEDNCATEHANNSSVTGHCDEEETLIIKKEVCITPDLLDLKDTTSNCKDMQSKFVDEIIKENGAEQLIKNDTFKHSTKREVKRKQEKQLIKNNKSKHSTKGEVKRKTKLRSIVVLKNERSFRKHKNEHGWSNWEGGWGKHKYLKSQSNSKSSDVRESIGRYSQERSERHTAKYKENIHCGTPPSCKQIRNCSQSDMCGINRINSLENVLCSSRSGSPALRTKNARSQYTKDAKREWQGRHGDDTQAIEKESDIHVYASHSRRKNLKLDEMPRRHSSQKRSHSSSDAESSKIGRRLRCHRERYRKTGRPIKSVSTEHDLYAYQNHIHESLHRSSTTPESSCFTVGSSDCSELRHESGGKQKRRNLGVESQQKRNSNGEGTPSNRKNADPVCYRFDAKVLKERKKRKMHELSLVSQLKSSSRKYLSEIKRSPQLMDKSREEIKKKSKKHQKALCFQKDRMDKTGSVSLVTAVNDGRRDSATCAGPNDTLHDLHGKFQVAGKVTGTSDINTLNMHAKHMKEKLCAKYISLRPVKNKATQIHSHHSVVADTCVNVLNGYPQVHSSVQRPTETLDHSSISSLSDKFSMGKSSSNLQTRSVESNLNTNALKSKQTNLNAPLTNVPVFGGIPPIPQQVSPVPPPPVLTNSLSPAFSTKTLNHPRENSGIQVCPGRFGMEKQDSMQDNRKFCEVPHQKKHTLSTSLEDTKVTKVENRASDQLPNMFDLQIQLLNLSHALSLALPPPPPIAPLASKIPRNLQQDILRQLITACTVIHPQRPRNPGLSKWYNPLSDWDAPSPYSDELVSFSPPLVKDVDSCKEVNKIRDNHKKSSTDFDQQTSKKKKNSTRKKWENNDHLKKTVDAVKEVVLPLYSRRKITKDEYKQVMRVVVPKIFHCQAEFSKDSIDRHVKLCVPDVLASRSKPC